MLNALMAWQKVQRGGAATATPLTISQTAAQSNPWSSPRDGYQINQLPPPPPPPPTHTHQNAGPPLQAHPSARSTSTMGITTLAALANSSTYAATVKAPIQYQSAPRPRTRLSRWEGSTAWLPAGTAETSVASIS